MTVFDDLMSDHIVKESIYNIVDRLMTHQSSLNKVVSSSMQSQVSYNKWLSLIGRLRGQSLFYPYLGSGFGCGAFVELADGSVKYDFISGIGVHWSHGDLDIVKACLNSALMDTVMQGNLQQHFGSVDLYKLFQSLSGMDHVFLTSSGVMAWENAVKIGFHFKKHATRLLAFEGAFCGRTVGAAHVTDKAAYRKGIPSTIAVDYLPFYNPNEGQEGIDRCCQLLRSYLNRYPDQYGCMVFELIQGEGGFNVGSRRFFIALMSLLKQYDIPVYIDEIQTFGRVPQIFAFKMFQLEEYVDIVTVGKLSQVCATLFTSKMNPEKGLLSQTFTSSTAAIEASKVILSKLLSPQYSGKYGKISRIHGYFSRLLRALFRRYPSDFKGPFGVGTMIAFEIFQGDMSLTMSFIHALFNNGVIAFVAGSEKKRVRFLLPIGGVENQDIDCVVSLIEKTYLEIKEEK